MKLNSWQIWTEYYRSEINAWLTAGFLFDVFLWLWILNHELFFILNALGMMAMPFYYYMAKNENRHRH